MLRIGSERLRRGGQLSGLLCTGETCQRTSSEITLATSARVQCCIGEAYSWQQLRSAPVYLRRMLAMREERALAILRRLRRL